MSVTKADREEMARLEQELVSLFGKKSVVRKKCACRGDYRGRYDYSLVFDDGSTLYISTGMTNYLKNLREETEGYRFFKDNLPYLKEKVCEVIERDNRQAVALGLHPIEFVDLHLVTDPRDFHSFWPELVIRVSGVELPYKETMFYYACVGHHTKVYFEEKLNRPDDQLGGLSRLGKEHYSIIVMGSLQ